MDNLGVALWAGLLRVPLRSIPSGRLRRHCASLTPPRLRRCALRLPKQKECGLRRIRFFISYPPLPSVASPHGFAVASSAFATLTTSFSMGALPPTPRPRREAGGMIFKNQDHSPCGQATFRWPIKGRFAFQSINSGFHYVDPPPFFDFHP